MRIFVIVALSGSLLGAAFLLSPLTQSQIVVEPRETSPTISIATREDAYRQNNTGVALLEQFNYKDAAAAFRRALAIDPKLGVARINLAIALYNVPETEEALREATAATQVVPRAPQLHYILGLIAKNQNRADDAIEFFKRIIEVDEHDVGANVNLGQLYVQQRRYPEAIARFRIALAAEPYNTTAVYNLANALNRSGVTENREEGRQMLARFQELRQSGSGTSIGQNYLEQGRYAEAITSTGAEPDLVDRATPRVTFADASVAMLPEAAASGREAEKLISAAPNPNGRTALEGIALTPDNRLTEAARSLVATAQAGGVLLFDYDSDADLDLFEVGPAREKLYRNDSGKYTDATEGSGLGGRETKETTPSASSIGIGAVAGDYDNDNRVDLFVIRYNSKASGTLYRNEGHGKFSDQTAAANLAPYPYLSLSAAFVDADHDGDLDIFVAGFADLAKATVVGGDPKRTTLAPGELAGAPNMLLRNNGDGKFTDITEAAKVAGNNNRTIAVVPTDYDNRRDVDLLLVNYNQPPVLYRNLRNGTFRDVAAEVGLDQKTTVATTAAAGAAATNRFTCAAAGDINKDGFTDFFFGQAGAASRFAVSDGRGKFSVRQAPVKATEGKSAAGPASVAVDAAQMLDYDNDGLLDVIGVSDKGLRVWRNTGGDFTESSEQVLPAGAAPPAQGGWWARSFAAGDVDADGDTDMILRLANGQLKVARNDGGNRYASVRVQLAGKVSNRSGIASKIEMRAGSLWQKLETYAASPAPAPADLVFGLGPRIQPDAVRVIWPAGIVQAETELVKADSTTAAPPSRTASSTATNTNGVRAAQTLSIIELDRKPSSCPYLFTWNGEKFEFITDMMGGGEMGYWLAPDRWNVPDPNEYVRIPGSKLKEQDGRYKLRVTNELEEALFMDRLQLVAIAHPKRTEVYPNEGLGNPTAAKFKLYTTENAALPGAATDDSGSDVLPRLIGVDRRYVDTFKLHRIRGYAEPHTLTLDLGQSHHGQVQSADAKSNEKQTLLLMTGWTDYAFSSDNVAAAQCDLSLQPPSLQVRNSRGQWQTVIENIGVPVGRPQTVTVDLTGKFLSDSRAVRIKTNMRIYWDQILVDTSGRNALVQLTRLEPVRAELRFRGFSAITMPDGREPFTYDYAGVSPVSPWKLFPGRYTREGDVRELLKNTDDMFVISRPGDELAIEFDAKSLPALPSNWTRTFLLYVDGFSKEMDINSATPDRVAPLPFHNMKSYPYRAPERYPDTPQHRAYLERYNTRVVTAPVRRLIH